MRQKYPIESLLRPPSEILSAIIGLCAAIVLVLAPSMFMMTPAIAYSSAIVIILLVVVRRIRQVEPVLIYKRHIRKLPQYKLTSPKIPFSKKRLFLGKGFVWTQKHTQRLRDTLRPEVQKYIEMGNMYKWARKKEIDWEHKFLLKYFAAFLSKDKWWNPWRPTPDVGGIPTLHAIEPSEQDIWLDDGERVGHMLVLGTTRVGKTRFAEMNITQDIRRGDVTIVFDPKGDADLLRRVYIEAVRAGREDSLYIFHLGHPEISARYNSIGDFSRITEVATRVTNPLPNAGNSAAFKEFSWRFTNIIARAEVAIGRKPNFDTIARYIRNIEPLFMEYCMMWLEKESPVKNWKVELEKAQQKIDERNLPFSMKGRSKRAIAMINFFKNNNLYDPIAEGLISAFEYDKTYFDKIVASLLPLLEKLTTGKSAELISPDYTDMNDPRPIFDWMQVIRQRGIVYIGLDALSDPIVASAQGNSMFADLTSLAGRLYKFGVNEGMPDGFNRENLPKVSVHTDEFNELIGPEFIPMLNKSGGANFRHTVYTQTWSDVESKLESKPKAKQVAGNLNSVVMLRVREEETAEMLTSNLRDVEINSLMAVSGANDSADPTSSTDFTSRNEDRIQKVEVPLLSISDVMQLPKGQAFALSGGGKLMKVRMPLPDDSKDIKLPRELEAIAQEMKKKYRTGENWWTTDTMESETRYTSKNSNPHYQNIDNDENDKELDFIIRDEPESEEDVTVNG